MYLDLTVMLRAGGSHSHAADAVPPETHIKRTLLVLGPLSSSCMHAYSGRKVQWLGPGWQKHATGTSATFRVLPKRPNPRQWSWVVSRPQPLTVRVIGRELVGGRSREELSSVEGSELV